METRKQLREMLLLAFDAMSDAEARIISKGAQRIARRREGKMRKNTPLPLLRLVVGGNALIGDGLVGLSSHIKNS